MSLLTTIGDLFVKATPWISLGSNLLSTVKSFDAAKDIEKAGTFNRKVFEDEAAASWQAYEDQAAVLRHEQRVFYGEQQNKYAVSGVALEGTPMLVLNDILARQELDQTALESQAKVEWTSRLNKGALAEWEAYQQGAAMRSGALTNLTSTLLSQDIRYPWRASEAG